MHGILVGRGDIVVALLADPATSLFGRILDKTLVCPFHVVDIYSFMAIDTADLAVG